MKSGVALLASLSIASLALHAQSLIPPPLPVEPTKVFVLDLANNGFQLSSLADGVLFDMDGNGQRVRTAWTARGSDDAFVVLDANANGRIDGGREVLGSAWRGADGNRVTGTAALRLIQGLPSAPAVQARNGSPPVTVMPSRKVDVGGQLVLVPELPRQTGERAPWVGPEDDVFSRLRAWIDKDHDGVVDRGELMTFTELDIRHLLTGFIKPNPPRDDEHGNRTYLIGTYHVGANWQERPMNYVELTRK